MGWSWLERWMATRLPESSSVESCVTKPVEPIFRHKRVGPGKGLFDITGEEKESCGSNEVSISFDGLSVKSVSERDGFKPTINRKTARTISRRKTIPSYRCPKDYTKVMVSMLELLPLKTQFQENLQEFQGSFTIVV